jgi:hypothetical protein
MPYAVDTYLLWAIAEGGEPFGTQMPAFKDTLALRRPSAAARRPRRSGRRP